MCVSLCVCLSVCLSVPVPVRLSLYWLVGCTGVCVCGSIFCVFPCEPGSGEGDSGEEDSLIDSEDYATDDFDAEEEVH